LAIVDVVQPDLDDETANEALEKRIALLQSVNINEDGCRNAVMGSDIDNSSGTTKVDIFDIRERSTLLCCVSKRALTNINSFTLYGFLL
jgi:hypothetical protein